MANPVQALDAAILNHLRNHPRAHSLSSFVIRQLARHTDDCRDGRLPSRLIEPRMKALRLAGCWYWCPSRRYVVEPSLTEATDD